MVARQIPNSERAREQEAAGATGKWKQRGVPHKGWVCESVEDLGSPDQICEMCEVREIRYVHYMSHPDYPDNLGVGSVCAQNMEEDYEAPQERERILRNAASRRARWVSRRWRVSRSGNDFLNTRGYNIVIYESGARYGFRIKHITTGMTRFSARTYPTIERAKLAAFDGLVLLQRSSDG